MDITLCNNNYTCSQSQAPVWHEREGSGWDSWMMPLIFSVE